jgi:hypothetical protein
MVNIREKILRMRLSRRQKAGALVVFLGLCALIMDRLFILPQSAPAEQSDYSLPVDTGAADLASSTGEDSCSESQSANPRLAKLEALWLDKALDLHQVRDAFSMPPAWREGPGPGVAAQVASDPLSRFAQRHQLMAVARHGRDSEQNAVYVDDRLLTVGQELDGFKLIAIDRQSATFEREGQRTTLKLADDR